MARAGPGNAIERRDDLIARCARPDGLVLELGSGRASRRHLLEARGWVSVDVRLLPTVDVLGDAQKLPVAEGSVDTVIALELLEHLPDPSAALSEMDRVLRRPGAAFISVPSAVPRHDSHDYWRFTAEGLLELGRRSFPRCEVRVFGGTFEALGYLGAYYTQLVAHRTWSGVSRMAPWMNRFGHWLDKRMPWTTDPEALHTLAFDLLLVAHK